MTIGGWVSFAIFAILILVIGGCVSLCCFDNDKHAYGIVSIIVTFILCVAIYSGMTWYFQNTASGQRALIDQKSDILNGIERTITVYTADGNIIATYSGKIDIAKNDGGYIKFDFDGKRYIYYNCFVESIAEIG